ncbi:unnamed protein product [Urochloa humidicola]
MWWGPVGPSRGRPPTRQLTDAAGLLGSRPRVLISLPMWYARSSDFENDIFKCFTVATKKHHKGATALLPRS